MIKIPMCITVTLNLNRLLSLLKSLYNLFKVYGGIMIDMQFLFQNKLHAKEKEK